MVLPKRRATQGSCNCRMPCTLSMVRSIHLMNMKDTSSYLDACAEVQPDVPSKNRTRISREMFETTVRLDTLPHVPINVPTPTKLRAEIPRHTFGSAVRLDTVAPISKRRPGPTQQVREHFQLHSVCSNPQWDRRQLPSPSSRLLDSSEDSGRELGVDPEVATPLREGLPNPCNAVLLPKGAHAIKVQSVEFQDLACFGSNSSVVLCRFPALL